jgi:hypothetical protein
LIDVAAFNCKVPVTRVLQTGQDFNQLGLSISLDARNADNLSRSNFE